MTRLISLVTRGWCRIWLAAAIAVIPAILFAQTNATEQAAEAAPAGESLFTLVFVKGGPFMYIILLLSVGMVYLVVDAILGNRASKLMPPDQVEKLKELGERNAFDDASAYCEENRSALTNIVGPAVRVHTRGKQAMEETLAEHGAREASRLRTRLSYLNTIATIAPMLGLLGTVSGMIKAFGNIATVGMGKASLLADNISEALLTTAGGLIIAIPAMAFFFFFRNRVNDLMVVLEDTVGEIIEKFEK